MHLKKKLLAILAVLLCTALILAADYINAKNPEESLFSLFDKKETIYFWYDDETMSDYIKSAAVTFGERYDARVFPKLVSESQYLEAINHVTLHEENIPDAYLISNDSLEKAYLSGLAAPVQDVKGILNTETFPQTALDAVTYKDKYVGYPLYFETSILLYNESYLQEWARQQAKTEAEVQGVDFDEDAFLARRDEIVQSAIPTTITDILNVANTFDVPENVEGVFKWDVSDIFYNYYIVGNYMIVGGDCGDNKSNININNRGAVSCLEIYKNLNQFFYIESDTVNYESVLQDFLDGKIVFTIVTTDALARLEEASAAGEFNYEYGIANIPDPSADLKGRSLSVTGVVAVNGYSEQQKLANQFATFLADAYVNELYDRSGRVAANRTVSTSDEALQTVMTEYEDSVSLPKMIATSNFWIQLEILFSKVWNGGDVSTLVQELADQMASQMTDA